MPKGRATHPASSPRPDPSPREARLSHRRQSFFHPLRDPPRQVADLPEPQFRHERNGLPAPVPRPAINEIGLSRVQPAQLFLEGGGRVIAQDGAGDMSVPVFLRSTYIEQDE